MRDADGVLPAQVEVDHHRRMAIRDWLVRHDVEDVTVADLLARIAQVGEEVATAEAIAGTLPRRVGEAEV